MQRVLHTVTFWSIENMKPTINLDLEPVSSLEMCSNFTLKVKSNTKVVSERSFNNEQSMRTVRQARVPAEAFEA